MRALLILYLTRTAIEGGFGFEKTMGYGIYGAYGALVYLTPLAGGFLADKFLGFRKAILWGAMLMACGQFTLFLSYDRTGDGTQNSKILMYIGLGLLVLGNGFFKPNISSLIGRFYQQGDPRRDGAFTIFYMGINIGAFLTPLTCGAVGELEGWHYGFLLAGTGMIAGLLIFLYTVSTGLLEHHADPPGVEESPTADQERTSNGFPSTEAKASLASRMLMVVAGSVLFLPIAGVLLKWNDAMDVLLGIVGILAVGYMLLLSFRYDVVERQRMWVIIVLLFFTAV